METRSQTGRAIDAGRLLGALGALALLVALFLDWYSVELLRPATGGVDAWSVFEITDVLLAGAALLTLVGAAQSLVPALHLRAITPAALTVAASGALLLVVVNLLDKPPFVTSAPDVSLEEGAWIALAAALLMVLGAMLRDARISLVITPRERAPEPTTRARPGAESETEVLRQP